MTLIFRKMDAADFPACAQELIAAFAGEPWCESWTHDQALSRIDEIMFCQGQPGYRLHGW